MRLAAGVEYDGSGFFGWQRQRQSPTVQACLEHALSQVANHPLQVHCAGRTDTGVHAHCQVVHFDTRAERDERSWVLGTNSHLPDGISVLWVRPVPDDFHARFSARRRRYRYRILNRWVRPAIDRCRVAWVRHPLDAAAMDEAAGLLQGEHDFSSFRAVGCQARSPVRSVYSASVVRHGSELWFDIEANAFVYHMVRNVAGSLIAVGRRQQPAGWIGELLDACDRTAAGITAPAAGLYFVAPSYPDFPKLPTHEEIGFSS
ncbi:tRNA pseudouridine(38-40) synthase TruA [Wenzhouxiangella limi]|uniref:tRNA pseudouridine synthase A n=1 Tax=Wenzhouxiangella limi TaxID=2707351 RepID=A0A845V1X0_9GAMM|nr:tRNA pseudouridine(38-40) synthase TruA [Wenzhouxiangella limi]NDY96714.1 tRNA pseudouridine(38-40) synthase TruA [Wenzhouxiangella limi]